MMNRAMGVGIPQGQMREPERGEPRKVLNILPFEYVAVRFTDDSGRIIKEVWGKVGNTFYIPQDAEGFASALRPVKEVYAKQALAMLSPPADEPPAAAVVDIVSEETVEEGESA